MEFVRRVEEARWPELVTVEYPKMRAKWLSTVGNLNTTTTVDLLFFLVKWDI